MQKHLVAHKIDEKWYRRYVLIFKKVFPNFIYKILYSSKPFNPIEEVGESNGEAQEK